MKKILHFCFLGIILSGLLSCGKSSDKSNSDTKRDTIVQITIFYTNDEHGWMEATDTYGGAASLMHSWKQNEGYDGSDNYLILSGGDMWSGPAVSTWFQGESMVEIMNAMEYDAAAIGNHEFDFTVEVLEDRLEEQIFPLLAANIVNKSDGKIPDFAKPYAIEEVDGIKIGIIGLASRSTPRSTFPKHVEEYLFTDYAEAIKKYAKELKELGAKILIVTGHLCSGEMYDLSGVAKENGISIIGGGHCHEKILDIDNGVLLIQASSNMKAYAKVEFDYYTNGETIQNLEYEIVDNKGKQADGQIKEIVDKWLAMADDELSGIIGFTDTRIGQSSVEMRNLVCDSWLETFTNADVALTNGGGIRQSIPQGYITLGTIVGLLPFENKIVQLDLNGEQLKDVATGTDIYMGGMTSLNGFRLADGSKINDTAMYTVLTTDYLYSREDHNFLQYDPEPTNTYTHYRQPLIDWLNIIKTNETNPLVNYLDDVARN